MDDKTREELAKQNPEKESIGSKIKEALIPDFVKKVGNALSPKK
mgnify:CR=1 FL=1